MLSSFEKIRSQLWHAQNTSADIWCLFSIWFLVTSQSNEKNKSRLSLRYDCANYSWLFGDNPDLWNLNVLMFCPQKSLNIIPTLNLLDLDSNPRPVPPDMAPAKKPKYISIYLWDEKKNVCSEKNKKICTYLCAKNKGQERLSNFFRVHFIEVKILWVATNCQVARTSHARVLLPIKRARSRTFCNFRFFKIFVF